MHGGTITAAPQAKTIPAEEFSTLLSAQEVLDKVKEDAVLYRQDVVAEVEKIKEKAQQEGFEEGFKKWVEAIAEMEKEIARVHGEVEKMIVPIAIKAAKKIVNKELEQSEDTIVEIVAGNLKAVSQHKQVTIYVNKKDLQTIEAQKPRLKEIFEHLESLSIRERADVEPGGCIIETEGGIINAQLENRWRILENAFESLMKSKG